MSLGSLPNIEINRVLQRSYSKKQLKMNIELEMNIMNAIDEVLSDPIKTRTLIGVILSVVGNVLISIALNIQKFAHNRIQARMRSAEEESLLRSNVSEIELTENMIPKPKNSNYLKSRFWWLGYILMNLGEVGNFLAYGFAPASTVAPLGTVGLISNAIIAPFFLGERFRKRDFFGIILAITGAIMVVMTSKNTESSIPEDDFFAIFFRSKVMIYIGTSVSLLAFFLSISDTYGRRYVVIDISIVALFGGFTVLATKGVSSLLNSIQMKAFTYFSTYFMIVVLIATGILQVKYLNKALQSFDSTVVIPTQFVLFTLSAVVGSAILFDEFETFTLIQYCTFICGCVLTFIGVYCIASERESEPDLGEGPIFSDETGSMHSRSSSCSSNYRAEFASTIDSISHPINKKSSHKRHISNSQLTGIPSIGLSYSYGSQ